MPPIPNGYHTITAYLHVSDARRAIEFYKEAFGASELYRMESPDGRIGHAELQVGDSRLMLADEHPEVGALSPQTIGGSGVSFLIYTEDVDALFDRAMKAGATVTRPLANQFYGDRTGNLKDPFGHSWTLATHVEDVSPEEIDKRIKAAR